MSNDNQDKERLRDKLRWKVQSRHMERLERIQYGQRGFLRPQIIRLFEQQPMNGVEIMSKLQEMSRGWYRPSPGSIYPILEQLEKEGVIAKNSDGKFELTAAYAEQTSTTDDVGSAISTIESNISYLEDLQRTGAKNLMKRKDKIEKLTRRLEALNKTLQSRSES